MKRVICILTMLTAAVVALGHQNSGVEQQLMQMERDWAKAMMDNDSGALQRIEADDYSYTMESMKGDKPGDLDDAKTHAFAGTAELTDMHVRVFGDTAVVTGKVALRDAKYKAKDITGDYVFTDVFLNRNGRWQVVASHSNRVRT